MLVSVSDIPWGTHSEPKWHGRRNPRTSPFGVTENMDSGGGGTERDIPRETDRQGSCCEGPPVFRGRRVKCSAGQELAQLEENSE